jgi:hypothetical protein
MTVFIKYLSSRESDFDNMEPPGVVDDSFRNLFDKSAEKIHKQGNFEEAHGTLGEHFNHLENGHSRAVYQVPSHMRVGIILSW